MSTFAHDLSRRMTGHSSFWNYLGCLQGAGAAHTLAVPLSDSPTLDLNKGSPPFSRTLTRRPIKAMRSVHVEAKEVQHRVQARCG